MTARRQRALNVVKIGGGLTSKPGALDLVCREVATAGRSHNILVVPGGGPFADAIREFDRALTVSPAAAHWMAVLAMDQYAHVLAERIPGAVLVEETGALFEHLESGRLPVLAPSRWLRAANVLPLSWDATSDSVAAFVAGALDAAHLILIKPESGLPNPVDPYFSSALHYGMSYSILGCDRIEELRRLLSD